MQCAVNSSKVLAAVAPKVSWHRRR